MNYEEIVDYAKETTGLSIEYADALPYVKKRRNDVFNAIVART